MARRKRPSGGKSTSKPYAGRRPAREPGHQAGGKHKTLFLYGVHAVAAALANPQRDVVRLIGTREAMEPVAHLARERDIRIEPAGRSDIDTLLGHGLVHQGIALETAPLAGAAIEDLAAIPGERAIIVMIDRISDPHNLGAILRSAAAFGAAGVVLPDRHAPDITGTVAKSASGAAETVPVCRVTNLARALGQLKDAKYWAIGLDGEAEAAIDEGELPGRAVLVAGAEGDGLRRLTREHCDFLARIPIQDGVESLNLSNAVAVALYELRRGRG